MLKAPHAILLSRTWEGVKAGDYSLVWCSLFLKNRQGIDDYKHHVASSSLIKVTSRA